jgi:hypothetical protein
MIVRGQSANATAQILARLGLCSKPQDSLWIQRLGRAKEIRLDWLVLRGVIDAEAPAIA